MRDMPRSEEHQLRDIDECKALIADLEALAAKAERIALHAGGDLNDAADYIGGQLETSLTMARLTLRGLENPDDFADRRYVVDLRSAERQVA